LDFQANSDQVAAFYGAMFNLVTFNKANALNIVFNYKQQLGYFSLKGPQTHILKLFGYI